MCLSWQMPGKEKVQSKRWVIIIKLILISGKAQNGKDTVASIIKDKLVSDGSRVLITHYADLLKYICKNYFDWDGNKDENGRHLLQYIGTDVIRKKNPSLWVDFVAMMLSYFHENWDYVLIPDCRFPNEIAVMIENGFDVVHLRVERPGFENGLTGKQSEHASETALDDFVPDYKIINSGNLKALEEKVYQWIKENLYDRKA